MKNGILTPEEAVKAILGGTGKTAAGNPAAAPASPAMLPRARDGLPPIMLPGGRTVSVPAPVPGQNRVASAPVALPTPSVRTQQEDMRSVVRQKTQLGAGVPAVTGPAQINGGPVRLAGTQAKITGETSAFDIKAQSEAMTRQIEALQKERLRETAKRPKGAGFEYVNLREYELERQLKDLTAKRDDLLGEYYRTENIEQFSRLTGDTAMTSAYRGATSIEEDMEKIASVLASLNGGDQDRAKVQQSKAYLAEKYGVTQRDIDLTAALGRNYLPADGQGRSLWQLYDELEREVGNTSAAMAQSNYDFSRMRGYEQAQAADADYKIQQEEAAQQTREHPILSSAGSVLVSPLKGLEFLGAAARSWGKSDPTKPEEYVPLFAHDMPITGTVSTIRGTVSRDLEENTDLELFGRNVASFLYNTGMSIADSAAQVSTMGTFATLSMGMGAAADTSADIMARGGSNRQAIMGGLAAGAAEAVFEKISIDNLLKPKDITGWKSLLKETAKQAGVEASEEMFTEIANILSDGEIMRDKSNFNIAVREYMAQGMSQEEARKRAYLDNLADVVWAGVGGALSGGVMGGVKGGFEAAQTNGAYSRMGADLRSMDTDTAGVLSDMYRMEKGMGRKEAVPDAALGRAYADIAGWAGTTMRGSMLPTGREAMTPTLLPRGADAVRAPATGEIRTAAPQAAEVRQDTVMLPRGEAQRTQGLEFLPGKVSEQMARPMEAMSPATERAGTNSPVGMINAEGAERLPGGYIDGTVNAEEIQQGIQEAASLIPVKHISGDEFKKGELDLVTQVSDFFRSVGGKVYNPQLGDVILDRQGVKDDLGHGIGRKKAAAFAAVPAVLEHGAVIDYQSNWKGRGYDTAVVAAPVIIGGVEHLEGIVLTRGDGTNRFYVHEVLTVKSNGTTPFKTGTSSTEGGLPGGVAPSIISLLRQVADVKQQLAASEAAPVQPDNAIADGLEPGRWESILGEDTIQNGQKTVDSHINDVQAAADEWMATVTGDKTASVLTSIPKAESPVRDTLKSGAQNVYRKFVDTGEAVGRIGKELGDESLYAYYNFARASSNAAGNMLTKGGAQTDVVGNEVGQSLADIFEPIREKGDDYYRDFETYLFHLHNIDRMSRDNSAAIARAKETLEVFDEGAPEIARLPESDLTEQAAMGNLEAKERLKLINEYNRAKRITNKPVFGYEMSAMDSAGEATRLRGNHPEFEQLAEQVYQYGKNLMQYRVDSGLLTREQADHIEKTYPHYVPTYRLTETEMARMVKNGQQVSKTVGRAQGGTSDLMPLHIAMAQQTMQVVRNGSINRFGGRLLEDYQKNRDSAKKYIHEVQDAEYEAHPDYFDLLDDPTLKKENTFTIYVDGKGVQMTVDKALYEGIRVLTPGKHNIMDADFWKPAEVANSTFKALVTGYNPTFSARNFARDLQEAGLYSKDLGAWMENYPQAVKEIATNGEWWKRYQALGGVYSSVFDYNQGYKVGEKEHGAIRRNTVDRVEVLNMAIEQAPRLAEFMAQAKKHGNSMDSLMDAMLAAADVTTNFGRSGEVGRFLNRTFVPFLNPAIQGVDKAARTFLGKKSGKEWLKLIARVAALGIAPAIINELLNGDDPEWENVRQSDKDVNWLIGIGDGKYLKIPKGRDMSVAVMVVDRVADVARGEKVDWGGTIGTAVNQIAPPNPLENNVYAPLMGADLFDPRSPGKTWYGGDIESQRLQGYEPGQRYDENTDAISKAIGGALGVSPKKLNYILDQYSGVVGDFVLPLLTPSGNKNPLSPFQRAFVLDSVRSNRLNGDFYDTADKITYAKNGGDGAMAVVQRFWNRQAKAVSDVYARIREIENDRVLPNAERMGQVRQDRAVINGIQQNALDVMGEYEDAVRKHYTGSSEKEIDQTYLLANREVFGAEYALQVYNKQVYERAVKASRQGVDFENYFDVYFGMKDLETSNEKRDLLSKTRLTDNQKIVLYRDRISEARDDDILASVAAGLPFNDFLEAQNVYTDLNAEDSSATEKRTEFARWMEEEGFPGEQREMLLEAFRFATWTPTQKTTYEKLMDSGLSSTQAYEAAGGIMGLDPLDGKSQVSAIQKGRVIVDGAGSDEQKVAALSNVMGETEYAKIETAFKYQVPPDAYIAYREALLKVDNGNGSITQAEAKAAIDSLPLSRDQKAALWQLQNTSWKPGKNPYSASASRAVLEAYKSRPSGEPTQPQIKLRYGPDNAGAGTAEGKIQLRYGPDSQAAGAGAGTGQIKLRYGPDNSNPGTGIITKYK